MGLGDVQLGIGLLQRLRESRRLLHLLVEGHDRTQVVRRRVLQERGLQQGQRRPRNALFRQPITGEGARISSTSISNAVSDSLSIASESPSSPATRRTCCPGRRPTSRSPPPGRPSPSAARGRPRKRGVAVRYSRKSGMRALSWIARPRPAKITCGGCSCPWSGPWVGGQTVQGAAQQLVRWHCGEDQGGAPSSIGRPSFAHRAAGVRSRSSGSSTSSVPPEVETSGRSGQWRCPRCVAAKACGILHAAPGPHSGARSRWVGSPSCMYITTAGPLPKV